ncbi:MAG: hypothetical protein LBM16_05920, partial [Clostridiales bacterium]|nr:hypothetical protein [Clostridiales bacterium]
MRKSEKHSENKHEKIPKSQKKHKRKYIATTLGKWVLAVSAVSMAIVVAVIYIPARNMIWNEAINNVHSTAQASVNEIDSFIETQKAVLTSSVAAALTENTRDDLLTLINSIHDHQQQ